MGILNVTPDSFYADSRRTTREAVEQRAREIVDEGAAIIDIGGYSSRPGADEVPVEEEWRRVALGLEAGRPFRSTRSAARWSSGPSRSSVR